MADNENTSPSDAQAGEEFHAKVPPAEPLTTKGHQPGTSFLDSVPLGHCKTYPPGTAPEDRSFSAGEDADTDSKEDGKPSASDSAKASTSADDGPKRE